jgi:hypothetical protein
MTTTYPKVKARKPVGGFLFLTVQQLCLLWWAYRTRRIQLRDFRVWFAAQEMVARRCQLAPDQAPAYTPQELHGLVGGVGGEHLRASIRRLEALGLLTWSSSTLAFATSPRDIRGVEDFADFFTMHKAITNNCRRVPVPRQAVRLIAGGCRTAVIATMLGHMIRCLYYRDHRCISGGWCKASWIAEVFRVDLRTIKAARKHLVTMGWLQMLHTPQILCNRWGSYALISLSWTRPATDRMATQPIIGDPLTAPAHASTPPTESPPLPEFSTTTFPPPSKEHKQPLQELEHQQPAPQAAIAPPSLPNRHHPSPPNLLLVFKNRERKKPSPPPLRLQHCVTSCWKTSNSRRATNPNNHCAILVAFS